MPARRTNAYTLLPGGLARVELTRGYSTLVDASQLERILHHKWCAVERVPGYVYAMTKVAPLWRQVSLHTFLCGARQVDHRNRDSLDNRLTNLRPSTQSQNRANSRKARMQTSSLFKGVSWSTQRQRWIACVVKDGKPHRKRFTDERAAAQWYNEKATELYGDFACLNILPTLQ